MTYAVEAKQVEAQPIAVVRGRASAGNLPKRIRALFDEFYGGFKAKGGLNIVFYPGTGGGGEFDIECGVQVEAGANSSTPAGVVATVAYFGPYDQMHAAHEAIHQWSRHNGRALAGPSWEVYGHWSDDPAKLRTDIFYLLA
jgi:effector-binding domain-containing protein